MISFKVLICWSRTKVDSTYYISLPRCLKNGLNKFIKLLWVSLSCLFYFCSKFPCSWSYGAWVKILWQSCHSLLFHCTHKSCKSVRSDYSFPGGSGGRESACSVGGLGLIPGSGRSPGGEHGIPLQHSCLENPHGQRSPAGYSPWGHKEQDTTEPLSSTQHIPSSKYFWKSLLHHHFYHNHSSEDPHHLTLS